MIQITTSIDDVSRQISLHEGNYQRPAGSVRLLAVSKKHSAEKIRQVHANGIVEFGENYFQEALEKIHILSDIDLIWHFIGPIQANKTRGIAENFDWVQSVDRAKIAQRLSDQRSSEQAALNICVQVNLSAEASKSGIASHEVESLCQLVSELPKLCLRGLMAIPAPMTDFNRQRDCFRQLNLLFTNLQRHYPDMDTLSMGMSGDFEAAIAEGSTLVRIGTALFGERE